MIGVEKANQLVGLSLPEELTHDLARYLADRYLDREVLEVEIRRRFKRHIHDAYRSSIRKLAGLTFRDIRRLVSASDREQRRWTSGKQPVSFEFLFEAVAATRTSFRRSPFDNQDLLPGGGDVIVSAACDSMTYLRERVKKDATHICRPLDWAVTHVSTKPFWIAVAESQTPLASDQRNACIQLVRAVRALNGECPALSFEEINGIKGRWIIPFHLFHWLIGLTW